MCCPTLFGLEGIVADELRFGGGLTAVRAENGRVLFEGDERTLAWANLNLRCAERVLIRLAAFRLPPLTHCLKGCARCRGSSSSRRTVPSRSRATAWTLRSILCRTARRSSKKPLPRGWGSSTISRGWRRPVPNTRSSSPSCATRPSCIWILRAPGCTSAATARTAMPRPCARRWRPLWSSSRAGGAGNR